MADSFLFLCPFLSPHSRSKLLQGCFFWGGGYKYITYYSISAIEYLKENGVIQKDIYPKKDAVLAVLSEIEEERPDDISYMLEEFEVVND